MKQLAVLLSVLASSAGAVELSSTTLRVTFDETARGAVTQMVSSQGLVLGAARARVPLFRLGVTRTDDFTKRAAVNADTAKRMTVERMPDGIRLVYEDLGDAVARAVCTVHARTGEPSLRWGFSAEMRPGWALEETAYPCLALASGLGSRGEDDAVVLGTAKGGVQRNPGGQKPGWNYYGREPGNLVAQFGCFYDDRGGFYFAAEDSAGVTKLIGFDRTRTCLTAEIRRKGFASEKDVQPYDVVTAAFAGTAADPASWHDAADLYKKWALTQSWCGQTLRKRDDLPAWMKDAPILVRFGREWLADPDRIRKWMTNYWQKKFIPSPLIVAFWGWEKRGYWITPDYYPVYPDDATFARLVRDLRAAGGHAFPWPSGYHWTLLYDKKADGSFVWDDRARFDRIARPHAVMNRDGVMYLRTPSWLRGGNCACLCGGDPWTIKWWNEDVCLPLTRLGCEMIQVDQVVGGAFPPCWDRRHPHEPGEGRWKTDCFRTQLETMRTAMRATEPDSVVCFEEPNEHFNALIGIQDYRDCELKHEWASVFNYLYHEFVPPFQSNPRRGNRVWQAHCAADGQMPHLTPSRGDVEKSLSPLVNGAFEQTAADDTAFSGWDRLNGYQGVRWTGRWFVDRTEKKSGAAALRLEAGPGEFVQVAQNIPTDDVVFRPGVKIRFSAWLKSERSEARADINACVFAPGLKSLGGATLVFPKAGIGWQKIARDFVMPAGSEMIRVMINVKGAARVWVDDLTVETVAADGTAKPLVLSGRTAYDAFMARWVSLYHGAGRDWLAFGRQVKPPRVVCAQISYEDRLVPAVECAAYVSMDGRPAIVLVNATNKSQPVTLYRHGKCFSVDLDPDEIRILTDAFLVK